MASKLADLDVAATTGAWTASGLSMAAGSKTVTLRRKSDGAVLATRSFTVEPSSWTDDFSTNTIANYTVAGGTYAISGGHLNDTTSGADAWHWARWNTPGSLLNGYVEAKLCVGASTVFASLVARYVDATNFVFLQINASPFSATIYEYKNSVLTPVGYIDPDEDSLTPGQEYTFKLTFSGTTLQAFMDGVSIIGPVTAPNAAWSGVCGVRHYCGAAASAAYFDDLKVG